MGFAVHGLAEPIVDPILALMEVLTLMSAPPMAVIMAAIHDLKRTRQRESWVRGHIRRRGLFSRRAGNPPGRRVPAQPQNRPVASRRILREGTH